MGRWTNRQVKYTLLARMLLVFFVSVSFGAEEGIAFDYPAKDLQSLTFAVVDKEKIAMQTYKQAVRQAVRGKFYHRQPNASELAKVRFDVANELIDVRLLGIEAVRRGVNIDERAMDEALQKYNKKLDNMGLEMDSIQREQLLAEQRAVWVASHVLPELRKSVEALIDVTESKLKVFYEKNKYKFTQPAQQKVSIILLKVSPSAPSAKWQETFKLAENLHARIKKGESFASIAKEFSDHDSAKKGGDLGYIHQGMLVDTLQAMVNDLKIGEVTDPVWTLQGIVMFQLNGKTEPYLLSFDEARSRIKDLWLNMRKKQVWQQFLVDLRQRYADRVFVNQDLSVPAEAS